MALKELLTNLEEGIQSYPNHNTPSTSGGFNYGQSATRIFDNKTFRQRSYKFGEGTAFDRPGNEFSREPLIGKNIDLPAPNDSPSGGGFLGFIGSLTDGFVRGGIVNALSRSAKDVARITKFYLTSRGIGFIAKNVALQLTNPRIPVGSTTVFGLELDRNRTFNLGLNLIAQAGVNFSGIHFDRSGATPIFPEVDKYEKYYSDFGDGSDIGEIDKNKGIVRGNRLLTLYDSAILGNGEGTPEDEKGKLGQFVEGIGNKVKELTGRGGEELFSYNGGPGSTYGIGKTRILRATNTRTEDLNPDYDFMIIGGLEDALGNATKKAGYIPMNYRGAESSIEIYQSRLFANSPQVIYLGMPSSYTDNFGVEGASEDPFAPSIFAKEDGAMTRMLHSRLGDILDTQGIMGYDTMMKIGISKPDSSNIRDFRSRKRAQGIYRIPAFNYQQLTKSRNQKFIREQRVNMGNPGLLKPKHGFGYNVYTEETIDKINALDVVRVKDGNFTDQRYRDLIRFRIEAVDADKPTESDVMLFRAFLDDYSDTFDGNWNAFTYNGRGEELYTYQGFKRSVSFSFKIAAQSRHEMMPLYRKLNFLVSQTAPDYKGTRMRGNFVKVTIGSLLDRTPGIINNVSIKWQKDYPFEIAIDSPEGGRDTEMQVLPHVLDVSVSFTPVHNFLPKKSVTDSPFIFLHERNGLIPDARKWYRRGAAETLDEATRAGQSTRGLGSPILDINSIPEESVAAEKRKKAAEAEAERQELEAEEERRRQEEAEQAAKDFADQYPYIDDDEDFEIEEEEEYDPEPFDTAAIANQNQEFKDKSAAFQKKQQEENNQIEPIPPRQVTSVDTGVSTPPYSQKAKMPDE